MKLKFVWLKGMYIIIFPASQFNSLEHTGGVLADFQVQLVVAIAAEEAACSAVCASSLLQHRQPNFVSVLLGL